MLRLARLPPSWGRWPRSTVGLACLLSLSSALRHSTLCQTVQAAPARPPAPTPQRLAASASLCAAAVGLSWTTARGRAECAARGATWATSAPCAGGRGAPLLAGRTRPWTRSPGRCWTAWRKHLAATPPGSVAGRCLKARPATTEPRWAARAPGGPSSPPSARCQQPRPQSRGRRGPSAPAAAGHPRCHRCPRPLAGCPADPLGLGPQAGRGPGPQV